MNILIYVNTKQSFSNSKIGGIEILNLNLFNFLKKKYNAILSNKITKKISKTNWDLVISSNDAIIFNYTSSKRKILWLHNKLQIEKSFRKKQFFPIIKNNIECVFPSHYLNKETSIIYNFERRLIIPNFLTKEFNFDKFNLYKKKNIFIWAVQRTKGLDNVINEWKTSIFRNNLDAELHIFSINNQSYKNLTKYNIFFHSRVSRRELIKFYKKSKAAICLGFDETFCLNSIESTSMGVPIITFGFTALKEIIENKINGFIVKDYHELSNKISYIISLNEKKFSKISKSTFNTSQKYKFKIIKKKWIDLIENN